MVFSSPARVSLGVVDKLGAVPIGGQNLEMTANVVRRFADPAPFPLPVAQTY